MSRNSMINYAGEEFKFTGCPACAFAKHEFELPCGMVYEDGEFTLSQDWELPIVGFYVVCPAGRHVEMFDELTEYERNKMFELANRTIKVLKKFNICNSFNLVIQEKQGTHLHLWIMPQHDWMKEEFGTTTGKIIEIFQYAKNNFRTKENLDKIKEVSILLKKELN